MSRLRAFDAADPAPHAAVPPSGSRATTGGRRVRDMGSPNTSRADHPVPISHRACTPAATGGRAEVSAAAAARSASSTTPEDLSHLKVVLVGSRGPGFGSSPLGTGKPEGAAHT